MGDLCVFVSFLKFASNILKRNTLVHRSLMLPREIEVYFFSIVLL